MINFVQNKFTPGCRFISLQGEFDEKGREAPAKSEFVVDGVIYDKSCKSWQYSGHYSWHGVHAIYSEADLLNEEHFELLGNHLDFLSMD